MVYIVFSDVTIAEEEKTGCGFVDKDCILSVPYAVPDTEYIFKFP